MEEGRAWSMTAGLTVIAITVAVCGGPASSRP